MKSALFVIGSAVTMLTFAGCAELKNVRNAADRVTIGHAIAAEELRCEYRVNPLGIDSVQPRLSWIIQSHERGCAQTAYQILIASSDKLLNLDMGDLWDSGRVDSGQSNQIVYSGKPLMSRMRCYWKVRVWSQAGKASAWSK